MACDDVYKATLDAIAHDLQHASARRRGRPIELQPSALRSDINRTQARSPSPSFVTCMHVNT